MKWWALAIAIGLLTGACGQKPENPNDEESGAGRPSPEATPEGWGPDQLFRGTGLVFDEGKGAKFCLGGATDSLPPQCRDTKVRGWSWDGLKHEEAAGVRWGYFTLIGTYVDDVFTLKEEPTEPEPFEGDSPPIEAPCDEPAGGWEMPDPDKTSEDDLRNAIRHAESQPDSAGAWIDYIREPQTEAEMVPQGENVVLVLAFTGDAERHESEARGYWGGPLCIWLHERTQAELGRIQREVSDGDWSEWGVETTWSDSDITTGIVSVGVIVSPPGFEEEIDRLYGEGVVRIVPALRPIE